MAWSSRIIPFFIIPLLLTGPFISLKAQEKVLSGTVTEISGLPLPGATVYVPASERGTVTASDGSFNLILPPVTGGTITLVFSSVGFRSDTITVSAIDNVISLRIRLQQETIDIAGVQVTARRPDNITVIGIPATAGAVIPSVTGGVEAAIATLPGVSSFSELSSGYSVRGGSYDENLVYINDVEVYRPYLIRSGQQEGLSRINPDLTAAVNFSPGGFSASYGDRMSSVLDITYREPAKSEGSLSLSLLTSSAHAGTRSKNGKLWFIGGARYRSNAILLGSLDERGAYRPHFADIQAMAGFQPDQGTKLTLSLWGSTNRYSFYPQSRTTTFGTIENAYRLYAWFEGGERDRYDSGGGAMTIEVRHNDHFVSKFILSGHIAGEYENHDIRGAYSLTSLDRNEGTENQPDSLLNAGVGSWLSHARNIYRSTLSSASYRGSVAMGRNGLEWGATARFRAYDFTRNEWLRVDSAGYTLREETNETTLTSRTEMSLKSRSIGAEGWIISRTAITFAGTQGELNAGIRASYDTYNGELLVSPRISVKAELTPRISVYLASGAYHQPPGGREMMAVASTGSSCLKAQRSYHLTAGAHYDFVAWNRPFRLTAEAWSKRFDRLIPYMVDNVRLVYYGGNSARGYSTGLDMRVNGEFVPGVESWFSLSIMKSEMEIPSLSTGLFPSPFDQRVHFSIFFQDYLPSHPDFRAHINIAFGTGIPTSPAGRDQWDVWFRMPPYRRVDIGFSKVLASSEKSFMKELTAGFEIFNLADIRNTISYNWIRAVRNSQGETREYAVPNYLTRRSLNLKLTALF